MLALLASWLIITLTALALGNIILDTLGKVVSTQKETSLPDLFFMGLCGIAVLTTIFSFFIPISFYLLVAFIVFTAIYWGFQFQKLKSHFSTFFNLITHLSIVSKIIAFALLSSILIYALTTPLLYDEGLYHLQSMKWAEEYKTILGLGNLHGRFAFNSSFLLLSTLFNYHPTNYTVFFSLNSLCVFVFCMWLFFNIKQSESFLIKITLSVLSILSIFFFAGYLSSSSTDILATILVMYVLLNLVLCNELNPHKLIVLGVLAVFCTTLKLSSGMLCLVSLYAFYKIVMSKNYKALTLYIGFALLILMPWIARFVALSGYLIYPFPSIDIFSFDWKIPIAEVVSEKNAAYAWPRIAGANVDEVLAMPFYEWMPIWIKNQSLFVLSLYALASISSICMLTYIKRIKIDAIYFVAWSIAFIGFLFGFFTAPDPRFSIGFILMPSILMFMLFGKRYTFVAPSPLKYVEVAFLFLGVIWLNYLAVRQVLNYQPQEESILRLALFPQSIDIKKNEFLPEYASFTKGRVTIYYPTKNNQCFDTCLPCMPYMDKRIELRGVDLEDGFRKSN